MYSRDGFSNWHNNFSEGDYWRWERYYSVPEGSSKPWPEPPFESLCMKIIPEKGPDYSDGDSGAGWYKDTTTLLDYPNNADAITCFIKLAQRDPIQGDHLMLTNTSPAPVGWTCTKYFNVSDSSWCKGDFEFNGSVIVNGTLGAEKIVAGSISGNEISSSTTICAGTGNNIAKMSGLDTVRLSAGNADMNIAPFRVDQTGKLTATNANITGAINANNLVANGSVSIGGTSGSRIHISKTKIEVWDVNTLRVKIGDLS